MARKVLQADQCCRFGFARVLPVLIMFKLWLKNGSESTENVQNEGHDTSKGDDQFESSRTRTASLQQTSTVASTRLLNIFPRVHADTFKPPDELIKKYESAGIFNYEPVGETGWDRVKFLYKGIGSGMNAESKWVMESFGIGCVLGFVYGATWKNKDAVSDFIRRHNEMTFEGEFHARRKLHDFVFINSCKHGVQSCWRFGLFPALLTVGVSTSFAYRNYVQPLDFALCGAIVGGMWKFKLGPRAMLVSSIVTSVLGLFGGVAVAGIFWVTSTTVPEFRYWKGNRIMRNEQWMRSQTRDAYLASKHAPEEEKAVYLHDDLSKDRKELDARYIAQKSKEEKEVAAKAVEIESSSKDESRRVPNNSTDKHTEAAKI